MKLLQTLMHLWLIFAVLVACSVQADDYVSCFRFGNNQFDTTPEYIHIARRLRALQTRPYHHRLHMYSAINIIHNHYACASWKTTHYWHAALQLFGRRYPIGQKINLSSEYKCFCQDSKYKYYIHDAERYFIMEQWPLYDYPEFWSFIQNYPDYQQCIMALHDIVHHDSSIRQQLSPQAVQKIEHETRLILQQQQTLKLQSIAIQEQARTTIRNNFAQQIKTLHQNISDYQDFHSFQHDHNLHNNHLAERIATLEEMRARGELYEVRSYTISPDAQTLLLQRNQDIRPYQIVYGNQLQHVAHQDCIEVLEQTIAISDNSLLYHQKTALIDCIDVAREYNQLGFTAKAFHITDFCRALLDYGKAVAQGIALGIIGAAQDCIDHPIQTALTIAAGEYVLAYQLCKVLFNVADIGITSLYNPSEGTQKWNNYIEPINNIIDALYSKELSLRDAVQSTTQLAVHWQTQNKLLGSLGKFYKATKIKALAFIENHPSATPEQYLATPEGFLFKANITAENNKLPQACLIGNVTTEGELILPKVKTYEQARNMGLKIIGDVDVHTGVPIVGKQGIVENNLCGRRWHGHKVTIRLDHDPIKGAHVNVTDCRDKKLIKIAIPFEGSKETISNLCKTMNSKASLEAAKSIFEKIGDEKGLLLVLEKLKAIKE
jgi:hypothetical protein